MIQYKQHGGQVIVFLDGVVVGNIHHEQGKGFQYRPKGVVSEDGYGDWFDSLVDVKKELEGE